MKNKINSRKFFLAILSIVMSFCLILFKFNDPLFLDYFKQWVWLVIGVFGIYAGANVGQKFVKNKQ